MKTRRQIILDVISDAVSDLLYYGRKESETLPRGSIEEAIAAGEITAFEIIEAFRAEFTRGLS